MLKDIITDPAVIGMIITAIIVPILTWLGKKLSDWLNLKLGAEKRKQAIEIAKIIVDGVEQIAKKAGWDSQEKLNQAIANLRAWGEKNGIKYTDEQWRFIIEQAVFALDSFWEQVDPPQTP